MVIEGHKKFHSGQQKTSNEAQLGQTHIITTPENVAKVQETVHAVTLAAQLDMNIDTLHTIMQCL
jgi:hypothetical protein